MFGHVGWDNLTVLLITITVMGMLGLALILWLPEKKTQDEIVAATLTASIIGQYPNIVQEKGGDSVKGAVDLYFRCIDEIKAERLSRQQDR